MESYFLCTFSESLDRHDKWRALLTFVLTTLVLTVHESVHTSWFTTRHQFFAIYLLLVAHFVNFWAFILIITTSPGVIQKIAYEYENELEFLEIPKNEHIKSHVQISNVINVQSSTKKIKLCHTCNIYRPPRCHHCSDCGICIERQDHHCPWLGVCIGKYNYRYYYVFLVSLLVAILDTMIMCIKLMVYAELYILPIFLILFCLPALIFDGLMLGFHTYLSFLNLTTREYMDEHWSVVAGNPNAKFNPFKNFSKTIFTKNEREIKYKYKQYYLKHEGESSSDQIASNSGNPKKSNGSVDNSQEGKKSSKGSSSDEHNNSNPKEKHFNNNNNNKREKENSSTIENPKPKSKIQFQNEEKEILREKGNKEGHSKKVVLHVESNNSKGPETALEKDSPEWCPGLDMPSSQNSGLLMKKLLGRIHDEEVRDIPQEEKINRGGNVDVDVDGGNKNIYQSKKEQNKSKVENERYREKSK